MRDVGAPVKLQHNAIRNVVDDYRAARARSRELFDIVTPDAYYERPIPLRNPIVFYEGHLPAFAVNTLIKLSFGGRGIDDGFETLFARGIDPEDEASAKSPTDLWPAREEVQAYALEADHLIEDVLRSTPVVEGTFTILEHELMHQETLLYMFHELDYSKKRAKPVSADVPQSVAQVRKAIRIPAGTARLGQTPGCFGWDNEFPAHEVEVPAFTIDSHNVTNGDYLEYVQATGARAPHFWSHDDGRWLWRGMFAAVPLPLDAPVYVTHDEATAYARWKGARLPTEAEFDRAAYGVTSPGDDGNFDFRYWDPVPAGSYAPGGYGVYDLIGNGWEWTSTLFAPFDGFHPMASYPQYSVDFFDGAHYVMKGASPATGRALIRRSFRNWFRPSYPYVYATFRCVR